MMNLAEAAVLVATVAAYDNRTSDELTDKVWHTALEDIELADAVEAVHAHFRQESAWLMPSEIRNIVKRIRKERLDRAGHPDFPPGLDQVRERQYAKAWRRAIGQGMTREEATAHVDRLGGIVREIESPRPVAQLLAGSGFGKSVAS